MVMRTSGGEERSASATTYWPAIVQASNAVGVAACERVRGGRGKRRWCLRLGSSTAHGQPHTGLPAYMYAMQVLQVERQRGKGEGAHSKRDAHM
jgi:hypothetical protein